MATLFFLTSAAVYATLLAASRGWEGYQLLLLLLSLGHIFFAAAEEKG